MTSFMTTPTPHTGDENPGGTIRQGEGFGFSELAFDPTGDVREECMISLKSARTMGETVLNNDKSENLEAGGPCSPNPLLSSVIAKGIQWGATPRQAGGPVSLSPRNFIVAFNEVVFCSKPMPGGLAS